MTWWKRYGWAYNPFAHLDAAQDPHLLEYLVWPGQVDLQGRGTALVLAPPGGGKTALRVALTRYALLTYGAIAPVVVVPEAPPHRSEVLWEALARAVARRAFWQALQFFGILPWHENPDLMNLLIRLWQRYLGWPWSVLAAWLQQRNWISLEYALGPSFIPQRQRGISEFLSILSAYLSDEPPSPFALEDLPLVEQGLHILREHLGAQQVWVLVDGLDGFPETQSLDDILPALTPMQERSPTWANTGIYLKVFLPLSASSETLPVLAGWAADVVALRWSKPLLVQMLRARVRAASQGLMDSLDPLAHPEMRPVEVRLVESLPSSLQLPREVILRTNLLLETAAGQRLMPGHWSALEQNVKTPGNTTLGHPLEVFGPFQSE